MLGLEVEPGLKACENAAQAIIHERPLIIASNRGPVTFQIDDRGELLPQRGGGGLVTALTGLANNVEITWIASAATDADAKWEEGLIPLENGGNSIHVKFVTPPTDVYEGYYNVIANPLLWFLQHSMWDFARAPTINHETWDAWNNGYVEMNRLFAQAIAAQIEKYSSPALVMIQDYQLYLVPAFLRQMLKPGRHCTLTFFVHIPWPGPEDWGFLPSPMRNAIIEGLCAADLVGFQTRGDKLNFLRTCGTYLGKGHANYTQHRIWYHNHVTHVRDFPISIDVDSLRKTAETNEVKSHRETLENIVGDQKLIVRIDRTEPSKNIVRGFQAFEEMLSKHPEHREKVIFIALLVPSRLEVNEYQDYLNELMAAAGRINALFGNGDWEPVRVLVGENYPRAVAALQIYDVLLVNAVTDGMNLVAKEGPTVNLRNGVVVLSERAGANQQLGESSIVISPCDVVETADALHQGLVMPADVRKERALNLRYLVEREDIYKWLCWQLEAINQLNL